MVLVKSLIKDVLFLKEQFNKYCIKNLNNLFLNLSAKLTKIRKRRKTEKQSKFRIVEFDRIYILSFKKRLNSKSNLKY